MANIVQLEVCLNTQRDGRGVPAGPIRGYLPGDELVSVTSLELVAPDGVAHADIAQAVFDASSRSARLEGWMVPIALRWRMSRQRPLAVGDVVSVCGVGYAVTSAGWTQIEAPLSAA